MGDDVGRMHFRRMDEGTDADFANPFFERTAEFCARYDEVSFDRSYPSEPMSTFEPLVRRVLRKPWTPPA